MSRRIALKDLDLVRELAATGSVTAAARRLHVTQPAISQRLAALQKRLDLSLFERLDQQLKPTAAGERLLQAAGVVERVLGDALNDLDNLRCDSAQRLRLATQCYTTYRWLPFVIGDMQRRLPEISIDLVADATADVYAAMDDGLIDVGLVAETDSPPGSNAVALFDDELFAVLPSGHRLAERKTLSAVSLAGETLVLYSGGDHPIVEQVLNPANVAPGRLVEVQITEAIVELVRSGLGISVLAGWAYHDLPDRRGLTARRITRGGLKRTWYAVSPAGRVPEPLLTALTGSLRHAGKALKTAGWRLQLTERESAA